MKRILMVAMLLGVAAALAACGGQRTALDQGVALYKQGDCAAAQPFFDQTIARPNETMDIAYAYFLKAKCAENAGDAAGAYENYYAAKIVVCYDVATSTEHENLNTYARSEYCERILPDTLHKLAPDVGAAEVKAIKAKINAELNARYMQQFSTSTK
ncbi:hypothetical protein GKC30_00380 [Pseudodesulfovibrio sp. F-1]|uniref:Lipoprotein n=2 Tax=Pseudodesulfovibrio alkaliphilus TaxID=2661613 RepID=A0A7K1KJ54_9BACT|nr:hypothetical protein [Pseudodesulfovibrio alkaliphilus]